MELLVDLPSRGNFVHAGPPVQGAPSLYVCDHDTQAPDDQIITTDPTNILIRALTLRKDVKGRAKGGGGIADARKGKTKDGGDAKGKRVADRQPEGKQSAKRQNIGSSREETNGASPGGYYTEQELQSFTVERLKTLLKEHGYPLKGRKDELVNRAMQIKK
ncbi:hypothetical protein KFL_000310090 [Klebsormidium nitens]|uniref:SAP domain-containing protein n=1 Tax=Klebsormidium nitens TaxID=105231 RepID=A0A1Y1HUD1_KLENI|nr:hypothetical protein KFL_000310090 [Klebsormidium nitens]|eukprot:GAQ79458.1 hypothetical protein KFL_000310090 [Klebsormidium nitens]